MLLLPALHGRAVGVSAPPLHKYSTVRSALRGFRTAARHCLGTSGRQLYTVSRSSYERLFDEVKLNGYFGEEAMAYDIHETADGDDADGFTFKSYNLHGRCIAVITVIAHDTVRSYSAKLARAKSGKL